MKDWAILIDSRQFIVKAKSKKKKEIAYAEALTKLLNREWKYNKELRNKFNESVDKWMNNE